MLNKLCLFAISLILLCGTAFAQNQQIASVYHNVHKIQSKILNQERSIWVRVPLNYLHTEEKFPIIYMLDGHAPQPSMMAGIIEQQAWGKQMPEMILVSIQNINRSYDFTPTVDARGGRVGGGNNFMEFIEKEVIPLVEKNYRTQPYRIFAGHSLGGLAVVYSFVSRPNLFNAYIAASPVLHYDKNYVIREAEKLFNQKRNWNKRMFLGLGDEPRYKNGWNKFQKLLKTKRPKGFDYEFREFPKENHGSVVLPAYYWGLRKIYEGWLPKQNGTIANLESHYKKLSKRFGYEILIPEETLNQVGYQFLRGGKIQEAINIFKKNVKNYPKSANVYDSLGEAYEKNGSMQKAKENYTIAHKIAMKKNDLRRARVYQANVKRVSAKIK